MDSTRKVLGPALPYGSIVLVLSILSAHASAFGEMTYQSERFGYSFSLPHDWIRIPNEVLQDFVAFVAAKPSKLKWIHDAAFQRNSEHWFEGAYVVVQVWPLAHQVSERKMADFVKMLSGIEPQEMEKIEEVLNPALRPLINATKVDSVYLDKKRRCFVQKIESQVAGESVVVESYAFFGRRSIVYLHFSDARDKWSSSETARTHVFNSFRFDPSHAYDEALSWKNGSGWRDRFAEGIGSAIGIATVVWLASLIGKARRKNRRADSDESDIHPSLD